LKHAFRFFGGREKDPGNGIARASSFGSINALWSGLAAEKNRGANGELCGGGVDRI
jgi:hypothetical protein